MFGGQLCCYGKPVPSIDDKPAGLIIPSLGHVSSEVAASGQSHRSVIPASSMAPHTVQPVSEPESRDSKVDIVTGVSSDSTGTQSSNGSVPAPVPMEVESGHGCPVSVSDLDATLASGTGSAVRDGESQRVQFQRAVISAESQQWPMDDKSVTGSEAWQSCLHASWNSERLDNPGRYTNWYPPGSVRQRLCSLALDGLREYHSAKSTQSNDTVESHGQSRGEKRERSPEIDSTSVPACVSSSENPQKQMPHLSAGAVEDRGSTLHKICENGADTEVEFVDSDVFDRLMLLSSSGVSRDDSRMWKEYCSTCKRPVSESEWSKVTAVSEKTEPTCMVMMSRNSNEELPPQQLSAAGRKPKLKQSLSEFSRAYSTPENPVDPTPENLEKWLDAEYPRDSEGVSIRHQINKTMPEEKQWVDDLMAGKICPLAAAAFDVGLEFDPPPWAEKLRLALRENSPGAKTGGRIKCPVHLREAMTNFHSDLYIRKFIVPATGCETYASVLIIRKPDDANGKPRGFRFVVDLRNRNETIRQIANQLPEASLLFEYLRDAVAISLFDVRDGYWNCPLHEESQALTAFQSEAGEWMWKCLPQGLSCAGPFFQAWIVRIFRKYNIVINQTKYIDLQTEMKTQARAENLISVAAKLSSMLDECDLDTHVEPELRPLPVESTLSVEGGVLKISKTDTLSHDDPRAKSDRGSGNVVNATTEALNLMRHMAPIFGSNPEALSAWADEVQGPAAYNAALQSLSALSGGLSVAEILKKSRDERRPEDLGIWKGKGFASLYLDDALTRALESNAEHRLQVLTFLRICTIERIPLGAAKAEIFCKFVRFLGMINGNGLLAPCPNKVVAIVQLERPWDLNTLQQFLGAVNWFRRHISDHAEIQNPLNDLTRKGVVWTWTTAHENAWLGLKRSLMSFPVLRIFDPTLETVLYTDSSKIHVGGCLTQRVTAEDGTKSLVAISYFSRSLRGPELSYPIQQQEMLAVVGATQVFEHYLLAAKFTVRCCVDHKSLTSSFKGLSKIACDRITRWVQKISIFNLSMQYLPGELMEMPDLLSRCLQAPDDAWKSMDVIDHADFEYAPLAALEPRYLSYLRMHSHALDTQVNEPVSADEEQFDASKYWMPHEKCMMLTVAPQTSTTIAASDYWCCPEWHSVYESLCSQLDPSVEKMDSDKKLASELISKRYKVLDLAVPALNKLTKGQLKAIVLKCRLVGGLMYYQHNKYGVLLVVPNIYGSDGINHRQRVFNELHATPYGGHRGRRSTYLAIQVRYFWKTLAPDVKDMVKACHECNVSKISRQPPQGLLQPVEVPLQIAQSYNIDRIGPFPESKNGNHMLMIVVDRFSRWVWLEALKVTCTSEQFADIFVNRVVLRGGRGIPESIVSDNDTLITANFWTQMFKRFGTQMRLSSARTQSTNGLAERYVAVVEEILRTCVNYKQTDWEEMTPHIEFVVNNQTKDTLTGLAPTKVELGIVPVLPADLISDVMRAKAKAANQSTEITPQSAAAKRIDDIITMRDDIIVHLDKVQQTQKLQADKRRSTIDELIKVGAKAYVFMPAERLQQHGLRPSRKLGDRCYGPFDIVERISANAFKLDLSISASSSRIIDVFHVKYLKAASSGPYPSPVKLLPAPVNEEEEEEPEWELERILDRKSVRNKLKFLVQYKGYPLLRDCEWRPEAELEQLAPELLESFRKAYDSGQKSG
jgi:hypothetical protein